MCLDYKMFKILCIELLRVCSTQKLEQTFTYVIFEEKMEEIDTRLNVLRPQRG